MRDFASPLEFSLHLLELSHRIEIIEETALEKCAVLIETDAKAQIGFYQPQVGPFQDWAELADSTEADKARKGYPLDAPLLREGDLRNSIEHEVVGREAVIGSKSDIAEYQEFGTATIPPRPFIGPAAFRNKENIQKILGHAIVEGITGGQAIHASLGYDAEIKP
jgi:HK97 gp10 family phage protein